MSNLLEKMSKASQKENQVKIIAVGGCGISVLDQLLKQEVKDFHSVAIDTDNARLAESECDSSLLLGQNLTDGYGTGGDEQLGARSLSGSHLDVRQHLAESKANIFIGGLGGGTATALLPELAKISRSLGVLTLVVATKPFRYEGIQKTVSAKRKIHSLFRSADSVFMINNESVVSESTAISAAEAVKRSDSSLVETIEGILSFLVSRKRLLLDFGAVKGQLTRGGLSAFACGISAMRNNAIEALKAAIDRFASSKCDISKAPSALIQFSIDDDVLMDGVKNAFGVAQRIFSKDAQLAMGVVFNGVKQGKTKVNIIATGLPLYNEVVESDFSVPSYINYDVTVNPIRKNSFNAGRMANAASTKVKRGDNNAVPNKYTPVDSEKEEVQVLNPLKLTDDELKIPAYLRRRMLRANDL